MHSEFDYIIYYHISQTLWERVYVWYKLIGFELEPRSDIWSLVMPTVCLILSVSLTTRSLLHRASVVHPLAVWQSCCIDATNCPLSSISQSNLLGYTPEGNTSVELQNDCSRETSGWWCGMCPNACVCLPVSFDRQLFEPPGILTSDTVRVHTHRASDSIELWCARAVPLRIVCHTSIWLTNRWIDPDGQHSLY